MTVLEWILTGFGALGLSGCITLYTLFRNSRNELKKESHESGKKEGITETKFEYFDEKFKDMKGTISTEFELMRKSNMLFQIEMNAKFDDYNKKQGLTDAKAEAAHDRLDNDIVPTLNSIITSCTKCNNTVKLITTRQKNKKTN